MRENQLRAARTDSSWQKPPVYITQENENHTQHTLSTSGKAHRGNFIHIKKACVSVPGTGVWSAVLREPASSSHLLPGSPQGRGFVRHYQWADLLFQLCTCHFNLQLHPSRHSAHSSTHWLTTYVEYKGPRNEAPGLDSNPLM